MAILVMDGFDVYNDITDLISSPGWTSTNGNPVQAQGGSLPRTGGAFGGAAVQFGTSSVAYPLQRQCPFDYDKTYVASFYFKTTGFPTTTYPLCGVYTSSGTRLFGLFITNTATISVSDQTSNFSAAAASVLTANSFYHIEVKFKLGTAANTGTLEIRVGGTVIYTLTGLNLFNASPASGFRIFNPATGVIGCWYDDLVILDSTGDANNDYLGGIRIDTIRPNADTAQANFALTSGASGYALINDAFGSADTTGYIESYTVGAKSEFELSNLVGGSNGIMAVQPRIRATKSDAGSRTYRGYLKSGAVAANGPTITPAIGWLWHTNGIFEKAPDTEDAWTDNGINALKLGLEVVS
ncbi:hypothetical protein [Hyphomicrobium sp.]|uniref:hypothetical protein n=1 Tax=Hyphomicrobium sp. TaxID=82 RepID=UPI001D9874BE|nr:hypothetical protein [Hyphomicrobium sp.]MBY0560021.1 hypothetical protein [Hyphomicrobium sp.]